MCFKNGHGCILLKKNIYIFGGQHALYIHFICGLTWHFVCLAAYIHFQKWPLIWRLPCQSLLKLYVCLLAYISQVGPAINYKLLQFMNIVYQPRFYIIWYNAVNTIYLLHGLKNNNAVYLSLEIAKVPCPKVMVTWYMLFQCFFYEKAICATRTLQS